jgi:hypothetical protein
MASAWYCFINTDLHSNLQHHQLTIEMGWHQGAYLLRSPVTPNQSLRLPPDKTPCANMHAGHESSATVTLIVCEQGR